MGKPIINDHLVHVSKLKTEPHLSKRIFLLSKCMEAFATKLSDSWLQYMTALTIAITHKALAITLHPYFFLDMK